MNSTPNINKFGATKRPNIKKIRGPRGSEGGGSVLANSLEIIYVYGFLLLPMRGLSEYGSLGCFVERPTQEAQAGQHSDTILESLQKTLPSLSKSLHA